MKLRILPADDLNLNINEQRARLQVLVDGTSVARSVHACANFPVAAPIR